MISEQKESPEKKYCVSEEKDYLQDLNFKCYMEAVDYEFDRDNGNMVPKCLGRRLSLHLLMIKNTFRSRALMDRRVRILERNKL